MRMLNVLTLLLCIVSCASSVMAVMCPFCDAPFLVMAEQIRECDHLLLGKWIGGDKPKGPRGGTSRFEIVDVGFSTGSRFKVGDTIEIPRYIAGTETATYSLMGPNDRFEDWHSPSEVSAEGWKYLAHIPPPVTDSGEQSQRLLYFLEFFEHPDQMISDDAFAEFAAAPYDVVVRLKDKLPREKILTWLQDPRTAAARVGFYGLLVGLCGNPEDAAILEKKILILDADFRPGIDGVMAGYVLLTGEQGLRKLEEAKTRTMVVINTEGREVELPFSETYAVMRMLRFMWTYESDRFTKDRLKQSMRTCLDRPELADLVITDLARWKDWSIQDRLMAMYDHEKFSNPAIKLAIVRYLQYCSRDNGESSTTASPPDHAVTAERNLKILEEKDPRTVRDAKRSLVH